MTRRLIDTRKCDRCGHYKEGANYDQWGVIRAFAFNGKQVISHFTGRDYSEQDVCPACLQELFSWWKSAPGAPMTPPYLDPKDIAAMSETKFTPGPWHFDGGADFSFHAQSGECLGEVYSSRADAALIATAPEMYELLEWIALFADVRSQDESKVFARVNRGAMRTIRDKSLAALAKARGDA